MILALESAWNRTEIHHAVNPAASIMGGHFYPRRSSSLLPAEQIANSEIRVPLHRGAAMVTRASRTQGTDGGKPFVQRGCFPDTWSKRSGEWKCVADQETLIH